MNFGNFSLNGGYTLSFRYNGSREWYVTNAGVNIQDQLINDKYVDIGRVSATPRKGKCFAVVDFNELVVSATDLAFDLTHDYPDYGVNVMTKLEAIAYLKDFTTCTETSPNVFELRASFTDPLTQTVTPAITINLN